MFARGGLFNDGQRSAAIVCKDPDFVGVAHRDGDVVAMLVIEVACSCSFRSSANVVLRLCVGIAAQRRSLLHRARQFKAKLHVRVFHTTKSIATVAAQWRAWLQ